MTITNTVFFDTIKFGKFILLAFLLILSFINGHKEYICENPRKFMWDSFSVGLMSALGISIIAFMRGRSDLIPNLSFIAFFLFFTYNVFREFSGLNASTDEKKLTQGESKQMQALKKPLMYTLIGTTVFLVLLAVIQHQGINVGGPKRLLQEAFIFGLCTAFGELVVAVNHKEPFITDIAMFFGNLFVFAIAHIVLQYGGFYSHVFN
jgi:hypothetical protein